MQNLLNMTAAEWIAVLLGIIAVLFGVIAFFLRLGIDVMREALKSIGENQRTSAAHTAILQSHADAIDRHERVLERLLKA